MKKIAFITLMLVGTMGVATAQETSETIEVPAKTSNLKRGFRMLIQGSVDYLFESYSAKTMITFGYQISPYLYFGSGFGVNFLSGPKIYVPEIPVFARCRATLLDRANTPFVDYKVAATIFDRLYLIGGIPFFGNVVHFGRIPFWDRQKSGAKPKCWFSATILFVSKFYIQRIVAFSFWRSGGYNRIRFLATH